MITQILAVLIILSLCGVFVCLALGWYKEDEGTSNKRTAQVIGYICAGSVILYLLILIKIGGSWGYRVLKDEMI